MEQIQFASKIQFAPNFSFKSSRYYWKVSFTGETITCLNKLSPFAKWQQNSRVYLFTLNV